MGDTKSRFFVPISGNVAGNALVQLTGGFVTQFIGAISSIWLARVLGAAGYGRYALVQSFVGIFYVFSDLAINNIVVREMTQRRAERDVIFFNAMAIKLI